MHIWCTFETASILHHGDWFFWCISICTFVQIWATTANVQMNMYICTWSLKTVHLYNWVPTANVHRGIHVYMWSLNTVHFVQLGCTKQMYRWTNVQMDIYMCTCSLKTVHLYNGLQQHMYTGVFMCTHWASTHVHKVANAHGFQIAYVHTSMYSQPISWRHFFLAQPSCFCTLMCSRWRNLRAATLVTFQYLFPDKQLLKTFCDDFMKASPKNTSSRKGGCTCSASLRVKRNGFCW